MGDREKRTEELIAWLDRQQIESTTPEEVHLSQVTELGLRRGGGQVRQGWECPVCHRVWAPYVAECPGPHTSYSTSSDAWRMDALHAAARIARGQG